MLRMEILWNKELAATCQRRVSDQLIRLRNTSTPLTAISILMYKSVMENFKAEGRPTQWQKLSPLTLALRRKGKGTGSPKILQDTGHLRMSIYPEVNENEGMAIVGTNVPYAGLMQRGGTGYLPARTITPRKKKGVLRFVMNGNVIFCKRVEQPARTTKIPARPFLLIQSEDKTKIFNIAVREWGIRSVS